MKKLTSPFQIIKKSVDIFGKKENFIFLVKLYLPLVFFPLISIAFAYFPFFSKNSNAAWFIALTIAVRVIFAVVGVLVTAAAIISLAKVIEGKTLPIKKVFKDAWRKYWLFLLLNVVLSALYLLGFVLLIIPGIILTVWLVFARFIMIEKGTGIKAAILQSKAMVKGIFWKTVWRLIVFGIFCLLAELILTAVPFGIGSIVYTLCGGLFLLPSYLLFKEISV